MSEPNLYPCMICEKRHAEIEGAELCERAHARDAALVSQATKAQIERPRIWALHCPFTKKGFPNIGSFGSTVRPVVIIPMETWTRLCREIPALGATQFEVGSED